MTKNRYSKKAIRSSMLKTGESYSVAARTLANAPLSTGWANLDRALLGGFKRGKLYLFGNSSASQASLNDEMLLGMTLPNIQIGLLTDRDPQEVKLSLAIAYLAETLYLRSEIFDSASDIASKVSVKRMDREQIEAHLDKNLRIFHIQQGDNLTEMISAIREEIEANPRIKAFVMNIDRKTIKASSKENSWTDRGLSSLAENCKVPAITMLRYSERYSNLDPHQRSAIRTTGVVHLAYAAIDLVDDGGTPSFDLWKHRSGATAYGQLSD